MFKMKVMVTGGAGFIGSELVTQLHNLRYKVSVLDSLITGSKENLPSGIKFYHGDVRDKEFVFSCISQEKPHIIFHLAAQVSVPFSIRDSVTDTEVNIVGTLNVLEAVVKHRIKKLIFSSSAAVYGTPRVLPINENHPIEPLSGYGVSKYAAELYVRLYSQLYGLEYTILRYGNVYGPGQPPRSEAGVVSIFMNSLLTGETPTIFGDGEQTRDFVYVKDVAVASILAMEKGKNLTLNIGTNHSTSIKELYFSIAKSLEIEIEPKFEVRRQQDILDSFLDISQAKKYLKWMPIYNLEVGLKDTLYSFKPVYVYENRERIHMI